MRQSEEREQRAGLMVMATGRDFPLSVRGGLAVTAEFAGLSALGVSLAALMWAIVAPKGAVAEPAAHASVSATDRLDQLVTRLSRIDDPFTRGGGIQTAALVDASGFILHSTRVWGDGFGTAILSPSGGQQGAYAVGEEVTPGVALALVASDHVEIDVNGQRMRVAFPGANAAPVLQAAASLPANYMAAGRAANLPTLSGLPLQPASRNGQQVGFEVTPHDAGGMLAAAGLRPGDVLLSVNGVSAASADLATYRAQLLSGQSVDIRFERAGQIHTARLGNE